MTKAQCLWTSLLVTLSRNNELGLYMPRSLLSAALGHMGAPTHTLVEAPCSALVGRQED